MTSKTDEFDAKAQEAIDSISQSDWGRFLDIGDSAAIVAVFSSALRFTADAVIEECAAALDQRTKENDYAPSGGSDFLRSLKSSPGRVVDLVQATSETNGPKNGQLHAVPTQHWAVTVSRNGEEIVTIESNCLSGREIDTEDRDAIRTAAQHLLAFIGCGHDGCVVDRTASEFDQHPVEPNNLGDPE